jgi:hypothetical protein
MTIPGQIEKDFISGKASYRTMQFAYGGQNILPVGQNQSIVIFGYVYCPAGNGFVFAEDLGIIVPGFNYPPSAPIQKYMCQEILIWSGNDFFPFVENVKAVGTLQHISGSNYYKTHSISADPMVRSCYIQANEPVSVAVALLGSTRGGVFGNIPVTSTTPELLSWGGYPTPMAVQTDGGGLPNQFLQPLVQGWDRPPYSYGLIPAFGQDQYWQSPDPLAGPDGPYEPSREVVTDYGEAVNAVGSNYKLTLHYALYNNPEK